MPKRKMLTVTTFEQIPIEEARRIAARESSASLTVTPHCAICGNPVPLQDCKTDDRGKAVHERCYVTVLIGTSRPQSQRSGLNQL